MLKKVLILLLAITFVNCGGEDTEVKKTEDKQITKEEAELNELMELENNEMLVATIQTNMGTIELELFARRAPRTVKNFAGLAKRGYYDGVTFHRIIDNFMIQGGDPSGTGRGGESYYGGKFEDEFHQQLRHDQAGILSMANAGPNTNGSQFFITLRATPHLDGRHSVFGKVIAGMDVVKAIGKVETTGQPYDKPLKPVIMEKVTVQKRSK